MDSRIFTSVLLFWVAMFWSCYSETRHSSSTATRVVVVIVPNSSPDTVPSITAPEPPTTSPATVPYITAPEPPTTSPATVPYVIVVQPPPNSVAAYPPAAQPPTTSSGTYYFEYVLIIFKLWNYIAFYIVFVTISR